MSSDIGRCCDLEYKHRLFFRTVSTKKLKYNIEIYYFHSRSTNIVKNQQIAIILAIELKCEY